MESKIAGYRARAPRSQVSSSDELDSSSRAFDLPPAAPRPNDPRVTAADRLDATARLCTVFYGALAVVGYLAAVALILLAAMTNDVGFVPGVSIAVGITGSLLPVLMLCHWAQAYAADMAARTAG